jgi:transposase
MSHPIAQPLRPLTDPEQQALQRVSRAPSESVIHHQRAIALLAVDAGKTLSEAARAAGWKAPDTVTRLIRRFNERGLAALDDLPRSGHPRSYGPAERGRIEQELQRTLRDAPDGLPQVSTFTILHTIHEAGYTWQQNRTWCKTGTTLPKGKHGVEERHDPYTQGKKRSLSGPI